MYIANQSRNGDVDEFFSHENQAVPPSLSDMGELRHTNKSDLVSCLCPMLPNAKYDAPTVTAKIFDGAVLVNMLLPKACKTFSEYSTTIFMPYLHKQLSNSERLDVVWDRYIENSLKGTTRIQRGSGQRMIVGGSTPIPRNWASFLRVDENKKELFTYLADCISAVDVGGKEIYSTKRTLVVSGQKSLEVQNFSPSDH